MAPPSPSWSEEFRGDIPPHAHYIQSEQGWACNDGYRQVGALCVLDSYGLNTPADNEFFNGEWQCRSGHREPTGHCVQFVAPAHASLVGEGQWECDWGFQRVGSRCEEITPPAHGYLDASGHEWVCYPGFKRVSEACMQIAGNEPAHSQDPAH
jgi:hypothetical protein